MENSAIVMARYTGKPMDKPPFPCYNLPKSYESAGSSMPVSLLPKLLTHTVTDLTVEHLHSRGIRLLMLDFDNTVVPYTTDVPTDTMTRWLRQMQSSDIILCVVSNSKRERVRRFCAQYGLDCVTHAKKPFSRGIRACLRRYGVPPEAAALVGDQIYTDTLGANCAGVTSILVDAIHNHNLWLKARHILEIPWIIAAKKRRLET